jgi:hypothetical protein
VNRSEALNGDPQVVTTATEFLAAVERGEAVAFEIDPGNWLRSDIEGPPNFLQLRLENMREQERLGAEWASDEEGDSQ